VTFPTTEDTEELIGRMRTFAFDLAEGLSLWDKPEWGATGPLTKEEHLANHAKSIEITTEAFGLEEKTQRHFICIEGSETIYADMGMSPNSPKRAQYLVGLLTTLPNIVDIIRHHADWLEHLHFMPGKTPGVLAIDEITALEAQVEALKEEIKVMAAQHDWRVKDLLKANNEYLDRARAAERSAKDQTAILSKALAHGVENAIRNMKEFGEL